MISPQNDYIMTDMMADVIKRGTGRRALALGSLATSPARPARPTRPRTPGSTASRRNLVATVWVGYDQERPLGEAEEGARTALPIWIHFMREALQGRAGVAPADARRTRDAAHLAARPARW